MNKKKKKNIRTGYSPSGESKFPAKKKRPRESKGDELWTLSRRAGKEPPLIEDR